MLAHRLVQQAASGLQVEAERRKEYRLYSLWQALLSILWPREAEGGEGVTERAWQVAPMVERSEAGLIFW